LVRYFPACFIFFGLFLISNGETTIVFEFWFLPYCTFFFSLD